uniref:SEA domain-containing protein n=1 Tax=Pygocentrus nattereri TaxID=42514 RepID=A0AAR2LKQ2_PYGNA
MWSAHRLVFSLAVVSAIMAMDSNVTPLTTTDSPTTLSTTNTSITSASPSDPTSPTSPQTMVFTHTGATNTSSAPTTLKSEVIGPDSPTVSTENSTVPHSPNPMTTTDPMSTTHVTTDITTGIHSSPTVTSKIPENGTTMVATVTVSITTGHPDPTSPGNGTTSTLIPSDSPKPNTTAAATTTTSMNTTMVTGPANATMTPTPSTGPDHSTTTAPNATCPTIPCPTLSVCINSTCQCLAGTFLSGGRCVEAKVFPGNLRVNRTFVEEMRNPQSAAFHNISSEIVAALNSALKNISGYINSKVLQLTPGSVVATVDNVFEPNSPATRNTTAQAIMSAIGSSNGILATATFNVKSLCQLNPPPCDVKTTTCADSESGIATCTCMAGFISTEFTTRSCIACASGERSVDNRCEPCPFGYSGFNCNDSSLLALVVVACVLGGLLLILIVAMIIYCVMNSRKNSKHVEYASSPYSTEEFHDWPAQGITPIPRATVSSNSDNMMEMSEPRKNHSNGLTGSYDLMPVDNLNTFKGKNPSRYSYLVQGHENPYFIPGDEPRST